MILGDIAREIGYDVTTVSMAMRHRTTLRARPGTILDALDATGVRESRGGLRLRHNFKLLLFGRCRLIRNGSGGT